MKIPDFAVSSQEAGFDEFLKVFNEYFKLSCRGEFLFYGASDGQPQRDDIRWTNKFILPQEAIALLTGKQLTEGDFAHVSEHQSAMEYLQTPSLKEMESQPKLLPTQESVKEIDCTDSHLQVAHLQQQLKQAKEKLEAQGNLLESVWEKYIKLLPAKDLASLIDLLKQVQSK